MAGVDAFEGATGRYEAWFRDHHNAYRAEVRAVEELMPAAGRGMEVGVGTGRFAAPLGIRIGIDPSPAMLRIARTRGVDGVVGVGEALPFPDAAFDVVLLVTTVCFLDDFDVAFREARRVLASRGGIVVGFVDRSSALGRTYLERREENPFYREATFYTVDEVVDGLERAGFGAFEYRQTLSGPLRETGPTEPIQEGHGAGSFVVVRASVRTRSPGTADGARRAIPEESTPR